MKFEAELTDTFGGEANYSWVRRRTFEAPPDISDLALVRRAKRELGITGERTTTETIGSDFQLSFPRRVCMVAFITCDVE